MFGINKYQSISIRCVPLQFQSVYLGFVLILSIKFHWFSSIHLGLFIHLFAFVLRSLFFKYFDTRPFCFVSISITIRLIDWFTLLFFFCFHNNLISLQHSTFIYYYYVFFFQLTLGIFFSLLFFWFFLF